MRVTLPHSWSLPEPIGWVEEVDGVLMVTIGCRRCREAAPTDEMEPLAWLHRHRKSHIDAYYRAEQDPPA